MLSLPEGITRNDINQWLGRGWFLWGDNNKICSLYRVADEEGNYVVMDLEGQRHKSSNLRLIHPHWPICGAVNLIRIRCAVFVNRIQKRQYQRTYNAGCVEVVIPQRAYVQSMLKDKLSVYERLNGNSKEVIPAVFNPIYFSFQETMEKFKDGWASIATSPQVIVVNKKNPIVYYQGLVAGIIKGSTLVPLNTTLATRSLKHLGGEVSLCE